MFLGFSRKKLNGVRVHNDRLFVRVYRSCSMPGYNQHRVTYTSSPDTLGSDQHTIQPTRLGHTS